MSSAAPPQPTVVFPPEDLKINQVPSRRLLYLFSHLHHSPPAPVCPVIVQVCLLRTKHEKKGDGSRETSFQSAPGQGCTGPNGMNAYGNTTLSWYTFGATARRKTAPCCHTGVFSFGPGKDPCVREFRAPHFPGLRRGENPRKTEVDPRRAARKGYAITCHRPPRR